MTELLLITDSIQSVAFTFLRFWWLWIFFVLTLILPSLWLAYVQEYFKRSTKYILLELKIPSEVRKGPRAMEQVFMTLHSLRGAAVTPQEKWWDGEVTLWYSCELVSFGGEIHFYLQIPEKHRNMIEAGIYAQYADIEIMEAHNDYIDRLPATFDELAAAGYNLFGNELILAKPDAYPIRTYIDFEAIEEEQQLDPMGALLEVLAKIKPQEIVWLQILARPNDNSWVKQAEIELEKLKTKAARMPIPTETGGTIYTMPAPGEIETMKAINRNIAKPGFDVLIRYLYISPKEIHDTNFGQRAIFSALNQYASEAYNRFKNNPLAWTRASIWYFPYVFPKQRKRARQQRIYNDYRKRLMYNETRTGALLTAQWYHLGFAARAASKMVLNAEELATIYHPPTTLVQTGPLIKRVEARKVGPPAGLLIYGEGEDPLPGVK